MQNELLLHLYKYHDVLRVLLVIVLVYAKSLIAAHPDNFV